MSVDLRPGVSLPIPCRHCAGKLLSVTVSEGVHTLSCPQCSGSTLVSIAREGDRWRITSTIPEDSPGTAASGTPPAAPIRAAEPPSSNGSSEIPGLSSQARESIREEIRQSLAQGRPLQEVLTALASKHGIRSEFMSWYLKTADEVQALFFPRTPSRSEPESEANNISRKATRGSWSRARLEKLFRGRNGNGKPSPLAAALAELTEADLKRLISAKKLLPRLKDTRRKEKELEIRRDRLQARLERARAKAEKIELLIQRIMEK